MDIKDVVTKLQAMDIDPTDVRVIITRNPRFADGVVYIVSFKSGTVKLRDLRQKQIVHHTFVRWELYRRKEGIVQCSRCQRPGHGARNCNDPTATFHQDYKRIFGWNLICSGIVSTNND